ncbi:TIGR02391 family protein [Akkermansiaceae bacterium]|nr:TIGR02391 family protein [Akkermansiaceae bacterium]
MAALTEFSHAQLESICIVIADTENGLTGQEIGSLLDQAGIEDPMPTGTKWRRLLLALQEQQRADRCGNKVFDFLQRTMDPVRYVGRKNRFESQLSALNEVLCFTGLELGADGRFRRVTAVKTLSEAEKRAKRLRENLLRREIHPDVLLSCRPELLSDDYFHVVLEASKSVAAKIRTRTGMRGDGSALVDRFPVLGKAGMPMLAFNTLQTESEEMEQTGLSTLIKGLFGTFRNPTAHSPKIHWHVTEQDAIDLLTLASFLHRRLDGAARTPRIE